MVVIGLFAGLLTTASWIPQLARSIRTRSTSDFSWAYLCVLATGVAMWLAYGIVRNDLALEVTNVLTLVSLVVLIAIKARSDTGMTARGGIRAGRR
jgi:MtN3 and saliva related transmembrane protein